MKNCSLLTHIHSNTGQGGKDEDEGNSTLGNQLNEFYIIIQCLVNDIQN